MRETWYVLEDDSVVHPNEVDHNMTHKNGKVAVRGDVPSTRSVEVDEETGKRVHSGPHDHLDKGSAGAEHAPKSTKDVVPDGDKTTYKTRESKAK